MDKRFQAIVGCFSIIGVIFTILGVIVAILAFIYPRPIVLFLEYILPTPTPMVITVPASTEPSESIATATPVDQQDSPSAEAVPAGQPISREGVSVTLEKKILIEPGQFGFYFVIENSTPEQILVRYKPSFIKVIDNRGTQYFTDELRDMGVQPDAREKALDRVKQFTIDPRKTATLEPSRWYWDDRYPTWIPFFEEGIDPGADFLLVSIDKLVGMENLTWRYELK